MKTTIALAALFLVVAGPEARAACSGTVTRTVGLPTIATPIQPGKRAGVGPCDYVFRNVQPGDECTVLRAEISGTGSKPASLDVSRQSDGAGTTQRTPNGSDGDWSYTAPALQCSTLGCGNGRYTVTLHGMRVCQNQEVTLTITKG